MTQIRMNNQTGAGPTEIVFSLPADRDGNIVEKEIFYYIGDGSGKVPGPWKRGRPKGARNKKVRSIATDRPNKSANVFQFVNISKGSTEINQEARSTIRKHARAQRHRSESEGETEDRHSRYSRMIVKSNLSQIAGVDPFGKAPIKLEPYMHDLLSCFTTTVWKNFYSIEDIAGCNPMAEYWLPLAFQDSALFHSFLACAAVYTSSYTTIQNASKGLKHLHEAISIVNQRLARGEEITSRGTLAVIAGIAMIEKGSGNHDHWKMHMQGLKRLVDLRGGLETLYSEPIILAKIFRADLYGALDAAESPFFERPCLSLSLPLPPGHLFSDGFRTIDSVMNLDRTLRTCLFLLDEATSFWSQPDPESRVNVNIAKKRVSTMAEAARTRCVLTYVQYTLVITKFSHEIHDSLESKLSEFIRITLILYSLTILNEYPRSTSLGQQLGESLHALMNLGFLMSPLGPVRNSVDLSTTTVPVDFLLWSLLLATIVTKPDETQSKSWILQSFAELCLPERGSIENWEELKYRLSRYPWVRSVHEPKCWWLWCATAEARTRKKEIYERHI